MTEWQDIETAPKDGRLVLLASKHATSLSGIYAAYWCDVMDEWKFHTEGIIRNAVAWQPLPPPPNTGADK